jgi:hypothetical protein
MTRLFIERSGLLSEGAVSQVAVVLKCVQLAGLVLAEGHVGRCHNGIDSGDLCTRAQRLLDLFARWCPGEVVSPYGLPSFSFGCRLSRTLLFSRMVL